MGFVRKVRQYWSLGVMTVALAVGFPLIGSNEDQELNFGLRGLQAGRNPAQNSYRQNDIVQLNQVISTMLTSPTPEERDAKVDSGSPRERRKNIGKASQINEFN